MIGDPIIGFCLGLLVAEAGWLLTTRQGAVDLTPRESIGMWVIFLGVAMARWL